ncbi:hypothetical protein ACEUDJ_04470 [Aeromonas bivalvium]|uniref:Uncharacterized protein n=1 Tax=Aeromonas bivalvium TaxID=440079 RepID=A0ABW9GPJ7_9GAMM
MTIAFEMSHAVADTPPGSSGSGNAGISTLGVSDNLLFAAAWTLWARTVEVTSHEQGAFGCGDNPPQWHMAHGTWHMAQGLTRIGDNLLAIHDILS